MHMVKTRHIGLVATLFYFLLLAGCSTHMSKVEYEGSGAVAGEAEPVIGQVIVSDSRDTDSNWLGAIRGGYGNRLKTLRTEESTDVMVDKMYTSALEKSGIYSSSDSAPFQLNVEITKFDCSYYFNREAHAHVNVSLLRKADAKIAFEKSYKTDLTESGVGAGIFGDVDTLRDLAEEAMNETIDKMLGDSEFMTSLTVQPVVAELPDASARLEDLKAIYQQGLITEEEYKEKRQSILSEM